MTRSDADPDQAREDELLALRCQLGERPAFEQLIARWNQPLWRYLRRLANTDESAAEMLQDLWLRVIRGIAKLQDGSKLRAWLFGIARRVAMDRLRSQYATPVTAAVDPDDIAAEPDAGIEEDLAAMHAELARLPVVEREVLTLFYLKELSLTDVADVLGIPVGTVKSRLFRARKALRHELTARTGERS